MDIACYQLPEMLFTFSLLVSYKMFLKKDVSQSTDMTCPKSARENSMKNEFPEWSFDVFYNFPTKF